MTIKKTLKTTHTVTVKSRSLQGISSIYGAANECQ